MDLLVVHRLPLPLEAGHLVLHPLNPHTEVSLLSDRLKMIISDQDYIVIHQCIRY